MTPCMECRDPSRPVGISGYCAPCLSLPRVRRRLLLGAYVEDRAEVLAETLALSPDTCAACGEPRHHRARLCDRCRRLVALGRIAFPCIGDGCKRAVKAPGLRCAGCRAKHEAAR